MNQSKTQANVEARLRTMRILWAVFLATVVMHALLAYFIFPPADAAKGDPVVLGVLFAAGVSMIVLSFVVKRVVLARAVGEQGAARVQTALILAIALCEAGGLFGFVAYAVTRNPYSFLLFLAAAVGIILHAPRLDQLVAATTTTGARGDAWGSTSFK